MIINKHWTNRIAQRNVKTYKLETLHYNTNFNNVIFLLKRDVKITFLFHVIHMFSNVVVVIF